MATISKKDNSDIKKLNGISFDELFDIAELQHIQDQFSDATGVASIITRTDGSPITRPSNFCRLCNDIIRKTDKGLKNCYRSDAIIGCHNPKGPIVQPCLSGGLFDAGASITVGGKHIGNWLIGQVRNDKLVHKQMLQYANDIDADEADFMSAFEEVPVMSEEKFGKIAEMLYTFANSISTRAFNNYQLKQSIVKINVTEAELETERNLLRTVIDAIPDRIYAKDKESRFIICNNALAKRMGKSEPDEIIGRSDFDLVSKELADQYYANEQEIIRTGIPLINHEESMGNITGKLRWNLATKVPIKDKHGNVIGIIGVGRDITERKLAEEENRQKTILLQTLNAEKDKFFSILAHDLRGPLSSFMGATQVLTDEISTMTIDEIREIAGSMKTSAENVYSLLENLLEWSKLKQDRIDFSPVTFSAKIKIIDCVDQIGEAAKKKNIRIDISVPDTLNIYADLHMFESVIRNIISNSIKFTPKGGNIHLVADRKSGSVIELTVTDSGIGMSPEMVGKLFMLNERTNRKGTDGEPSSGLGLFLCKEFVERHGGSINLESKVGSGTTFKITFPSK